MADEQSLSADLIDPDIRCAETLPGWFYCDPAVHRLVTERVFARTWQWLGDEHSFPAAGHATALTLLPGCLDEPVLLTRDAAGTSHCLSNVCTHRGALVSEGGEVGASLRCPYHGRLLRCPPAGSGLRAWLRSEWQ